MINYSEKRQEYIKDLEALPYGEGVLVLPNAGLQREVRLHHMVKCIGLDTLAVEVINFLGTKHFNLIDRMTQELIVTKILREHKDELQYFGAIIQKDGLVRELVNLFTELRRCHVCTSDELDIVFQMWEEDDGSATDGVIAPVAKNHDVALLFRAYLEHLKDGLCDIEGQYVEAISLLNENADRVDELFKSGNKVFCDYYLSDMPFLNQLQMDFVDAFSFFMKRAGKKVIWEHESKVLEFNKEYETVIENLQDNGKQDSILLRKYASHRDELIGTFRDIRGLLNDKKAMPKDVCIVIRDFKKFSGAESLAKEYGIPVVLPHQEVLGLQPLCQVVLNQIAEQGTAEELALKIKALFEDQKFEKEFGKQYVDGYIDIEELQAVLQSKKAILNCVNQLVQSYKLSGLQSHVLSVAEFKSVMNQLFRYAKITLSNGSNNGVVLTDLFGALGHSFKYVYVLGMNDGEFTDQISENWIYNDNQHEGIEKACRKRNQKIYGEEQSQFMRSIGFEMFTSKQKYQENDYYFLELLRTATERMVFNWTENETSFPCGYVLALLNMFVSLKEEDWRSRLAKEQKTHPLSDDECQRACTVCDINGKEYYDVDKKRQANEKAYLGVIGEYGYQEPVVYSVTKFENFVKCPFAYMAQYIWHLDGYNDDEDDLSPLYDGNLMHDTMKYFVDEYMNDYKAPDKKYVKHYAELTVNELAKKGLIGVELAEEEYDEESRKKIICDGLKKKLEKCFNKVKVEAEREWKLKLCERNEDLDKLVYWDRQTPKILRVLLEWFEIDFYKEWGKRNKDGSLNKKSSRHRFCATEKGFSNSKDCRNNNEVDERIRLIKGREIGFTGRIDRVDVELDNDGNEKNVRVVDYKRNAVPAKNTDMQIEFYQEFLKQGKILGLEYLAGLDTKGRYLSFRNYKKSTGRDLPDNFVDIVEKYANQIRDGFFTISEENDCGSKYCPFVGLCRRCIVKGEE